MRVLSLPNKSLIKHMDDILEADVVLSQEPILTLKTAQKMHHCCSPTIIRRRPDIC